MSSPRSSFTATELIPSRTYRVLQPFTDYDGLLHPPGETWKFVAHSFLPYDDGLTIFTERDSKSGTFQLQWHQETQGGTPGNLAPLPPDGEVFSRVFLWRKKCVQRWYSSDNAQRREDLANQSKPRKSSGTYRKLQTIDSCVPCEHKL